MTHCDFFRAAPPARDGSGWSKPWHAILLALPLAIATMSGAPMLPHADGKVTVLVLDAGRITAISFVSSSADVRAALGR